MSLQVVVKQLQQAKQAAQRELDGITTALSALNGHAKQSHGAKRVLSKAARERIAAAQRKRWAKFKKAA